MGPINDTLGVEQGGVNSDNYYKMINNEQLSSSQASNLGVTIGNITISAIGQADDVVLTSNSIYSLHNLLHITISYCAKYKVDLVPDKTKLQMFLPRSFAPFSEYFSARSFLTIDNQKIPFSDNAEHVGVIRSTSGNLPNLLNRVKCHKQALGSVMSAGLAKGHRTNPAACIRVNRANGTPVLTSGLSSLVLSKPEENLISQHYKKTLSSLQKLHDKTPDPVVFFLSGCLPGPGVLHLRQLSLFGMISRLPGSILHQHAKNMLSTAKASSHSWLLQIRELCLQYRLPHPLTILDNPPAKNELRKLFKFHVQDYWQNRLREHSSRLTSLQFFKPDFMSLSSTHPLWLTAGQNPYEINKAVIQARMLSGRYRSEALCSFWSSNPQGWCLLPSCSTPNLLEDISHILISCKSLVATRQKLINLFISYASTRPHIFDIVTSFVSSTDTIFKTQFILDCSVLPQVIALRQELGKHVLEDLFYLTRTWCYVHHRERLRMLGRWISP